jgi:hypothetical protein
MAIDEFIAELTKIRSLFDWKLDHELAYSGGSTRRLKPRMCIRASRKDDPSRTMIEPIGAVCASRTGNSFSPSRWMEAASDIGLPLEDASRISAAVNDRTWKGKEGDRKPDPDLEALRQEIARAVGLRVTSHLPTGER